MRGGANPGSNTVCLSDLSERNFLSAGGVIPGIGERGGLIVAGHGGQALAREDHLHPLMRRIIVEWGSVIVQVKGDALTVSMLNADGIFGDSV